MRNNVIRCFSMLALCASLLLSRPALAQPEETAADSGWQFSVAAYLWGADIGEDFVDDLNFSGPTLGAVFRW